MGKKLSMRRNIARRISGVTMPITKKRTAWGRNWLCLCGSGKKYKHCCINEISKLNDLDGNASVTKLPKDIQNLVDAHNEYELNGDKKEVVNNG